MIKQIFLQGVASYSPVVPTSFGPLTKVNLLYGLNGSGKSTIGNYLQNWNGVSYLGCKMHPDDPDREVVVYNQNFMDSHFRESFQPGVFTLNEGNIEAENALVAAESELKNLSEQRLLIVDAGKSLAASQKARRETYLDELWALRKRYDNSELKFCFSLINTRERLADKVEGLPNEPTFDSFEALAVEAGELIAAKDQERVMIPVFSFAEQDVEHSPMLAEVIAGSDSSYLSEVIKELGNYDWIKQSFKFIDQNIDVCPFCQHKLQDDFFIELHKVFDQTYQRRIDGLVALKVRYESGVARVKAQYQQYDYKTTDCAVCMAELDAIFQKNIRMLADKVLNPSVSIHLESSEKILLALNKLVSAERDKITTFNLKVKNKKNHLEIIKSRFWALFRYESDFIITAAKASYADLEAQIVVKRQALETIREKAQERRIRIAEFRAKITNIDQAVDSINASLVMLGLRGFSVVREEGDLPRYRLNRPVQQEGVFKTLSEGEKTLITFLYFLEVCNGDLDSNSNKIKTNRVVVIDDPISSLSHNYIYDVAALIHRKVLSPSGRFKQVFILTHNLFFFHEMHKLLKKADDYSLFRVTKGQYTNIAPMKASDVQNDYQSFWQVIKDARSGNAPVSVIPNMMRNILEHYFNFVHKREDLAVVLNELADEELEFRALFRYINRESHSDAVNITDFGEIEPDHYVERFRQIFVRTGFEQHYEKMMS